MHLPSTGGPQENYALDLKYLPAFLLGFDRARCRPEVGARLEEIQEEMYEALAAYTFEGAAVNARFAQASSAGGTVTLPAPQLTGPQSNDLGAWLAWLHDSTPEDQKRAAKGLADHFWRGPGGPTFALLLKDLGLTVPATEVSESREGA
jgi:hypothetical protein